MIHEVMKHKVKLLFRHLKLKLFYKNMNIDKFSLMRFLEIE